MKRLVKIVAVIAAMLTSASASAQYYDLMNQTTNMLQTILQGGENYRGFIEASYLNGIGNKQANFVELSTTHGLCYGNLFFMGLGLGVDYMTTKVNEGYYVPEGANYKKNGVMIPMFTDFRLTLGQPQSTSFFIDLKIGAGFYVSNKYILVGDGYVNSSESFLLRPSIGFRVPVSSTNPKLAMNIGASYQLLTNSYWYNPTGKNSVTLNSFGVLASFEW